MIKTFDSNKKNLDRIRELTAYLNATEQELVIANRRYRAILDHAPMGMLMTSGRIIIDANKRLEEMLGYKINDLIGQSTRMIYDTEETYQYVGKLINEYTKEFSCHVNMKHSDGTVKEYTLKVTNISDDENVASIYIEFRGV
jgi:PAS domain S-box-containing protein